jgi:hypothetical protein
MIEWLQNYSGQNTKGVNMERTELENLRKEMARYKKKFAEEDAEQEVQSQSDVNYKQIKITIGIRRRSRPS